MQLIMHIGRCKQKSRSSFVIKKDLGLKAGLLVVFSAAKSLGQDKELCGC